MASERSDDSSKPSASTTTTIRKYSEGAPWVFKGRALYQLHAVKSSVARKFVPPELKLVEAFGYTLGGLFLAHYDGSPAGEFDEAVIIAGIVWNPPTSCAWAAGVLVTSDEARIHGRKEVGLPSHLAAFSHRAQFQPVQRKSWWTWFSKSTGTGAASSVQQVFNEQFSVDIAPAGGDKSFRPLCRLVGIPRLLPNASQSSSSPKASQKHLGLPLKLHLPNYSGKTEDEPNLLKYSCVLRCRMRVVPAAQVVGLASSSELSSAASSSCENSEATDSGVGGWDSKTRNWSSILMGKPLVSILFDRMVMQAEAPKIVGVSPCKSQEDADTGASQKAWWKGNELVLPGVSPRGPAPT